MAKKFSSRLLILSFPLLSLSCGHSQTRFEEMMSDSKHGVHFCATGNNTLYIGASRELAASFRAWAKKQKKLTERETFRAWLLAQSLAAPESFRQNSYGKVFKLKATPGDLDFKAFPTETWDQFLFNTGPQRSLYRIASSLDHGLKFQSVMNPRTLKAVQGNLKLIKGHPSLRKSFLRGQYILRPGEEFRRAKLLSMLTKMKRSLKEYEERAIQKRREEKEKGVKKAPLIKTQNTFARFRPTAIAFPSGNIWLAFFSDSGKSFELESMKGLPFPPADPESIADHRGLLASNVKIENNIAQMAFSFHGVLPKQTLTQLIELGLLDGHSLKEVKKLYDLPRHLLLKSPPRLLVEEHIKSTPLLEDYLYLNIPLYQTRPIGRVWYFYQDQLNPKKRFIGLDKREKDVEKWCTKILE